MKSVIMAATGILILLGIPVRADVSNEEDYTFLQTVNSLERLVTGWQDLEYSGSKTGTTEFLIISFSHGNPSCSQYKHVPKHKTRGGGWEKAVTSGNDDKSAEIWVRRVTSENINDPGQLETGGAGSVKAAIVVYDGLAEVTNQTDVRQCDTKTIAINSEGTGPYLVVAASDNGTGESDRAMFHYAPGDDRVFVYLTADRNFVDKTTGNLRGAIASLALKDVEVVNVSIGPRHARDSAPASITHAGSGREEYLVNGRILNQGAPPMLLFPGLKKKN